MRGCSRVSKGCEHCYAETVARRFSGPGQPYEGLVRLDAEGRAKAQWNGTVRFVEEHLGDPLRWTRPRKVFVNSMSDLFHEALRFEDIAAIFGVMAAAPKHTFQVLTKRPQRARAFFDWYEGESGAGASPYAAVCTAREALANAGEKHVRDALSGAGEDWPLPNVWLGVSVEDQASADERIPELLACPAAVRWVSDVGTPRYGTTLARPLRRAMAAAGIDRWFTPHGLRRTLNDVLRVVASADVQKAITGHSSESMRQHYAHVRCSMCHDSTWDHECDDKEVPCEACAKLRAALDEVDRE